QSTYDWHQLVIYDTTLAAPDGNSVFTYQYLTANNYGSTTVGINDSTTATGIQVLYNGSYHRGALPIVPGRAIKFTTVEPLVGVAEREGPPVGSPAVRAAVRVERNPFAGTAIISYSLPRSGPVALGVYDNSGRRVRSLVRADLGAGEYRLNWPGTDDRGRQVAAGIYWLRLETADGALSGKLVKLD
ncbi:MAG: FlgD immunoglobulin-like domain containing protein, partial [bacterium]